MIDRLWMAEIKDRVAAHYGIDVVDLLSERRSARIVWPRQVAMYLCRLHTPHSLEGIGRAFGNRDHSTVRYSILRVEERMALSPAEAREVKALSAGIEARNNGERPASDTPEMAERRRDLLAALLRCYRRRMTREELGLARRKRALRRLEAMAGGRSFVAGPIVADNTLEGSQ